jgi:hypothetical protein
VQQYQLLHDIDQVRLQAAEIAVETAIVALSGQEPLEVAEQQRDLYWSGSPKLSARSGCTKSSSAIASSWLRQTRAASTNSPCGASLPTRSSWCGLIGMVPS